MAGAERVWAEGLKIAPDLPHVYLHRGVFELHHGALKAADISPGAVKTVNGATFTVNDTNGKLSITDGKGNTVDIVQTDIVASNGVVHVISGVLMPPAA